MKILWNVLCDNVNRTVWKFRRKKSVSIRWVSEQISNWAMLDAALSGWLTENIGPRYVAWDWRFDWSKDPYSNELAGELLLVISVPAKYDHMLSAIMLRWDNATQ